MSRDSLKRLLAASTHVTQSKAADQVDTTVHEIITKLRQGQPVKLPGLGKFRPGAQPKFQFNKTKRSPGRAKR